MEQYVLLTGAKNNAGDFLIKHRAKQLLAAIRPDRSLVDLDAWRKLSPQQLDVINASKALILTGGPAVQYGMHPDIYALVDDLSAIKVPVLMCGVGWKAHSSSPDAVCRYELSGRSQELLRKTASHGYASCVRDYDTLGVLKRYQLRNVVMAGCPALYSIEHIGKGFETARPIGKATFSMGVSFVHSKAGEDFAKALILRLRDYFAGAAFDVAFHHSIDRGAFARAYAGNTKFPERHGAMLKWLQRQGVSYVDLAGTESKMLAHYQACDFHIGYRVHAHILMSSISRPSVLLSEDARALSLKDVIGGLIMPCHDDSTAPAGRSRKLVRALVRRMDARADSAEIAGHVMDCVDYEIHQGYPRISQSRANIDKHFEVMRTFLAQLP